MSWKQHNSGLLKQGRYTLEETKVSHVFLKGSETWTWTKSPFCVPRLSSWWLTTVLVVRQSKALGTLSNPSEAGEWSPYCHRRTVKTLLHRFVETEITVCTFLNAGYKIYSNHSRKWMWSQPLLSSLELGWQSPYFLIFLAPDQLGTPSVRENTNELSGSFSLRVREFPKHKRRIKYSVPPSENNS